MFAVCLHCKWRYKVPELQGLGGAESKAQQHIHIPNHPQPLQELHNPWKQRAVSFSTRLSLLRWSGWKRLLLANKKKNPCINNKWRMLFMKADSGSSARNKNFVFCALFWATMCIMEGMPMSHCSAYVCQDYSAGNKKQAEFLIGLKEHLNQKPRKSSPLRATEQQVQWSSVCLQTVCQETQWLHRAVVHTGIHLSKSNRSKSLYTG